MSTTVDERIVSMQFDNKQFESNAQTSLGTINKLKDSLNFDGATKGLENVNAASRGLNFAPLGEAVEAVRLKFSALEVMAVTALVNITNSAVNAGKRIASALTIDPIKSGLQEYETQINAVQTILANTESKGTTLDQVNAALDKLNAYADKTIYNFTEMTRNIGTFTAAGVDLETSVTAIQGIANLAAVSGSTSQQASTAMYQLSQALSSGTVKLMDWNSVVNAGMGGQVFQDALKQTARVHGIAIDDMIKKHGSFRETLQEGWLTADILTETLENFTLAAEEGSEQWEEYKKSLMDKGYTEEQAEEILKLANTATDAATKVKTFTQLMDTLKEALQSGWTQTWELIIGDFEEAKELWTSFSDFFGEIIGKSAEARNEMLGGAMDSNWDKMMDEITAAGVTGEAFEESMRKVLENHGYDVDAMLEKWGSFENAFRNGAFTAEHTTLYLTEAIEGLGVATADLDSIQRDLMKGIRGDDVKEAQKALEALGYDLGEWGADGIFGSATEEAIKAFQQDHGLEVTGVLDEETLAALKEANVLTGDLLSKVGGFISDISALGGRELLTDTLWNIINSIAKVLSTIKGAWNEIFPPMTAERLYSILEAINEFSKKLIMSDETAAKLGATFKGIFAVVDIVATFIKEVALGIFSLFGNFDGLGSSILDTTSSFGDWLVGLRDSIKETNIFGIAVGKVTAVLQKVIDKVKQVLSFLKNKIAMPGFEGFLNLMKGIWGVIEKVGSKIAKVGSVIGDALANAFSSGDLGAGMDLVNGGLLGLLLLEIRKFFKGFTETAEDGFGLFGKIKEFFGGVSEIFDSIGESLKAWQQNLKANILLKIAAAIGILALAILIIATIDPGKLAASLGAITVLFGDLMGSLAIFNKMSGNLKGAAKAVGMMIGLATAVLILAFALRTIASLSWQELAVGLVGVAGLMAIVIATMKIMGSGKNKAAKGATSMVVFAAAVKILASACKDLSSLSWDELAKGLVGVGVLMTEIAIFLKTAKFSGKTITTAAGIVILAAAMKILASACKDFSQMSWDELTKGIISIGVLLATLAIFTQASGNAKHVLSTGVALVVIGAAMKIFASAVKDFSAMKWEDLGRGLAGMAGALAAVSLALNLMPKNSIALGLGLVVVASSLLILVEAMSRMGAMSWEEIAKGLVTLGGSMLILSIGLHAMNGSMVGSAALLVAAAAIAVMTPALKGLGSMSWESIAKGLVALAGAFAVIGIAGLVLGPMVPTILGLAGAFALIGIGAVALGAGLMLIAAGFTALAVAGSAGATAVVAALTVIVTGVAGLIPVIAQKLGEAIVVLCYVIADSSVALGAAIKALVLTLIDVLIECIPALVDGALKLIVELLVALVEYTPQIVASIFDFLIALLDGIAAKLPDLIQSAVDVIMAFFSGVVDALSGIDVDVLIKGIAGVGLMSALMLVLAGVALLIPAAMIGVLGMGLVIAELALVLAAIGALAQIPGLEWIISEGGSFMQTIGNAIGGFIGGIIGGVAEGISSSLPQIGTDLSDFMTNLQPFLDGAERIDQEMVSAVESLVSIILSLTAANLLESITSWLTGESSLADFATQLIPFGMAMTAFSAIVSGNIDEGAVTAAANAGAILASMAQELPNSGGVLGWIMGENDMEDFAAQLVPFGMAITAFSAIVSGNVDETSVSAAANAGSALAAMAQELPNTGGVLAWIMGDNDLATFSTNIVLFGAGIAAFSDAVSGKIDEESVTSAATAGKMLAEMAATIPEEGGIFSWFTGDSSLENFATNLPIFGEGLKGFADKVKGIDGDSTTAAASAAASIAQMAFYFSSCETVFEDIGVYSEHFDTLGRALADFSSTIVEDVDLEAMNTAANTVTSVTGMLSASKDSDLSELGTALEDFGDSLETFTDDIADLDTSKMNSVVSDLNDLDASSFIGFVDALKSAGSDAVEAFVNSFSNAEDDVKKAGTNLVVYLTNGLDEKKSKCETAAKKLAEAAAKAIKTQTIYDKFVSAGKYLVDGFCAGITDNTFKAEARAKAMANAAEKAAKEALDINSPSKVFRRIGTSVPEGFAQGIDKLGGMVKNSAVAMADTAVDGTRRAISRIADAINTDIDDQPTIRPVLDLSEVEAGADSIGSMFGLNPSIGIMSNVGAINSMMNNRQNGANSDVISAINELGKKISASSGDTYQINGITYDDGSNLNDAVRTLVRAARVERRI